MTVGEIALIAMQEIGGLIVLAFCWGGGWAIVTLLDERFGGWLSRHAVVRWPLTVALALAVLAVLWIGA